MKKTGLLMGLTAAVCLVFGSGCGKKGSGEKAGEAVDDAGKKLEDAVDKDGPVEDAGESVDKAAKDLKKEGD